jgi:hypothetical protein
MSIYVYFRDFVANFSNLQPNPLSVNKNTPLPVSNYTYLVFPAISHA